MAEQDQCERLSGIYVGARDDSELNVKALHSTTLPSSKDETIEWSTFRAYIVTCALSIEENDLLSEFYTSLLR